MSRPALSSRLLPVLLCLLVGCSSEPPPVALTAESLDAYLRVAPTVRVERHRARLAREPVPRWPDRPELAKALACGEAFMEGLGWENDAAFWARLRFYEATSFLRLALIYSLRPRWKHLHGQLTEMGSLCLEEFAQDGGG